MSAISVHAQTGTWITHPWVAEGQLKTRFGLCVASLKGADWPQFQSFVQRFEALGFASRAIVQTSLVTGTPDDAITYYRALAGAGIQYFIPVILGLDAETVELLADRVIPARLPAGCKLDERPLKPMKVNWRQRPGRT